MGMVDQERWNLYGEALFLPTSAPTAGKRARRRRSIAKAMLALSVAVAVVAVGAAVTYVVRTQAARVDALEADYARVARQSAQLATAGERAQAELDAATSSLGTVTRTLGATRAELGSARKELAVTRARLHKTRKKLVAARENAALQFDRGYDAGFAAGTKRRQRPRR